MGKTIIIGAGGTGGHLLPAQSLAAQILQKLPDTNILFMAKGLKENPYFQKDLFDSCDIPAGALSKNPLSFARGCFSLGIGTIKSIAKLKKIEPDLVLGFGSYHVAPVLFGALCLGVPFILHEANAIPGKVNRFFSKKALWTAVHFSHASKQLSGKTISISQPLRKEFQNKPSREEALSYFGLDQNKKTILVFGGSQGAEKLNRKFLEASVWFMEKPKLQIIHFIGKTGSVEETKGTYDRLGLQSCVKVFENSMHYAWAGADFAICRSGASTIAEQIAFNVPAIFVPFPYAADDHQTKNAEIIEKEIGGAITIAENMLSSQFLAMKVHEMLQPDSTLRMKKNLERFRCEPKEDFSDAIIKYLSR